MKEPSQAVADNSELAEYTNQVVLLDDRLRAMSRSIRSRCTEIFTEFSELHDRQLIGMANRYRKLSEFTELLAGSIERNMAEISESDVTFGRRGLMHPKLRKYLVQGMDRELLGEIREVAGNHHDGDAASFLTQVERYTAKLRKTYRIEERDMPGPSTPNGWER